ncbi:uncharacterized protein V1516DRAFT_675047 [Lipomyces oligophaga]|uniref:uncharacterized protein n=1 Tax=Lipomyces oligophaga TaxID=45792 RepID=UPI0034CD0D76
MKTPRFIAGLAVFALSVAFVSADSVLSTDEVYSCSDNDNSTIVINSFKISYSKDTQNVTFDVAGTSTEEQYVTATLYVSAYGKDLFDYSFDPCDYNITQLCPIPAGSYSAKGTVDIPTTYADMIPSIAYSIPDLDGTAKLLLNSSDSNEEVACFQSTITNGKTTRLTKVTYVSAALSAGALALGAVSSFASTGSQGSSSPGFADFFSWTQSMAMNGMMSVVYPTVYSSFAQNFGWSTFLITWGSVQSQIDSFRSKTGGNTTLSSWKTSQDSTVLDYETGAYIILNNTDSEESSIASKLIRRFDIDGLSFSTGDTNSTSDSSYTVLTKVAGFARYIEHLLVPNANAFMLFLVLFCLVMAAIVLAIFVFRLVVEIWARTGTLPKKLQTFRERYWSYLSSIVVRVLIILYGTWVLYCLYQFKIGDSWATRVLAGVSLGIFTAILGGYTIRIVYLARKALQTTEGIDGLYANKSWVRLYGPFYGSFRSQYWWFFLAGFAVAVARSAFIALGDGNGMLQVVGQIVIEGLFLFVLLVLRPFNRRSGNVINCIISIVRLISLVCVLIFVKELGIAAETTTIVGIVLIILQAALTCILALLMIIQALIALFSSSRSSEEEEESFEKKSVNDPLYTLNYSTRELLPEDSKDVGLEAIGLAITDYDHDYKYTTEHDSVRRLPWQTVNLPSTSGSAKYVPLNSPDCIEADSNGELEYTENRRPRF